LRFVFTGRTKPSIKVLRLPESEAELGRVWGEHDSRNGRYYFYADIVIEPDLYVYNAYFDADTWVAIKLGGSEAGLRISDYFGRKIIASLVAYSTALYPQQRATMEERDLFEQQWTNKDLSS